MTQSSYIQYPGIPESNLSSDKKTISTLSSQYTLYADALEELVITQAQYPPCITLNVSGSHREKKRTSNNKTEETTVTDFDVNVDMRHLLVPAAGKPGFMEIVPEGTKAYRGTRRPTETRVKDIELGNTLQTWCIRYCEDPASVKSFALQRQVLDLNEARLRELLVSLVRSTNYLGHIDVRFPVTYKSVIVYSPGRINRLRTLWYVRWLFYLTFLWIFAWPYLFFVTKRYEIVTAKFPFATTTPCANDETRVMKNYTTQSEDMFFARWQVAIKRAVLGRMKGCLDEQYLAESIRQAGGENRVPITGNAIADGAFVFLQQALVAGRDINNMRGWGANS